MYEAISERAAIMEIDGGLPRDRAEQVSITEIITGSPPIASRVVFAVIELASIVQPARYQVIADQLRQPLRPIFSEAYEEFNA
jgi:hypothetical protein